LESVTIEGGKIYGYFTGSENDKQEGLICAWESNFIKRDSQEYLRSRIGENPCSGLLFPDSPFRRMLAYYCSGRRGAFALTPIHGAGKGENAFLKFIRDCDPSFFDFDVLCGLVYKFLFRFRSKVLTIEPHIFAF